MSLGSVSAIERRVSEAIQPATDEALDVAREATVKHTDGTSWRRNAALWALWTLATTAVTVFKIVANSKRDTLQALLGNTSGILVSDRATTLKFWPMNRRQVCWAHLLRKFVSFSEPGWPHRRGGQRAPRLRHSAFWVLGQVSTRRTESRRITRVHGPGPSTLRSGARATPSP